MKKLFLLMLVPFLPLPVEAERTYQPGYSQELKCYENVYREDYIPGTSSNPGRVVSRRERVEVPCSTPPINNGPTQQPNNTEVDDNSCVEGSIIGGLLGGGLGAALSQGDGRWWAIPTGIAGGAMVGCQVDGG